MENQADGLEILVLKSSHNVGSSPYFTIVKVESEQLHLKTLQDK